MKKFKPTPYKIKAYACKECGKKKQIGTNHFWECYWSVFQGNRCPVCAIEKPNNATTWECQEPAPDPSAIPSKWTTTK